MDQPKKIRSRAGDGLAAVTKTPFQPKSLENSAALSHALEVYQRYVKKKKRLSAQKILCVLDMRLRHDLAVLELSLNSEPSLTREYRLTVGIPWRSSLSLDPYAGLGLFALMRMKDIHRYAEDHKTARICWNISSETELPLTTFAILRVWALMKSTLGVALSLLSGERWEMVPIESMLANQRQFHRKYEYGLNSR
ncbi:uncharacterized protein BDR25DRAFT_352330 [Lindgomyces ingoldianus]|uniref:Uncharacterized protein n=1 Tax=Lindgomyces ingoldianus TaxID=673940 RepID=A0ACB6R4U1_9PLEO|nr:uncharacterized protein BDR25DRAFT_352330 [Lindgomyces ingoldianus]KAF2473858.1 hypothetical protein BDR25DRAFT_352330 [Lindgomyces ingoldianus]